MPGWAHPLGCPFHRARGDGVLSRGSPTPPLSTEDRYVAVALEAHFVGAGSASLHGVIRFGQAVHQPEPNGTNPDALVGGGGELRLQGTLNRRRSDVRPQTPRAIGRSSSPAGAPLLGCPRAVARASFLSAHRATDSILRLRHQPGAKRLPPAKLSRMTAAAVRRETEGIPAVEGESPPEWNQAPREMKKLFYMGKCYTTAPEVHNRFALQSLR